MTNDIYDCDQVDALLSEYLEGALDAAARAAVERHAASCARCGALIGGLGDITRAARALPDLEPPHDLWDGIAARIAAPVVPLAAAPVRRAIVSRRPIWLGAAAAGLVALTAGVTWMVARAPARGGHVATVAAAPAAGSAPASGQSAPGAGAGPSTAPSAGAEAAPAGGGGQAALVSGRLGVRRASAEQVYDQEITRLVAVLRDRRSQLDTSTVNVIARNLLIIDRAIAQSRAALARDPHSRFLTDQLNSALDQKVELLRTAAFLPARS